MFMDLGLEDPEALLAKAELAHRICELIAERKLTQVRAAKLLGVDQPKVSALLHGKLDGFSTERIFRFLNALGQGVEVRIRPARQGEAPRPGRVRAAAGPVRRRNLPSAAG